MVPKEHISKTSSWDSWLWRGEESEGLQQRIPEEEKTVWSRRKARRMWYPGRQVIKVFLGRQNEQLCQMVLVTQAHENWEITTGLSKVDVIEFYCTDCRIAWFYYLPGKIFRIFLCSSFLAWKKHELNHWNAFSAFMTLPIDKKPYQLDVFIN